LTVQKQMRPVFSAGAASVLLRQIFLTYVCQKTHVYKRLLSNTPIEHTWSLSRGAEMTKKIGRMQWHIYGTRVLEFHRYPREFIIFLYIFMNILVHIWMVFLSRFVISFIFGGITQFCICTIWYISFYTKVKKKTKICLLRHTKVYNILY
jgi:hypothetical protein